MAAVEPPPPKKTALIRAVKKFVERAVRGEHANSLPLPTGLAGPAADETSAGAAAAGPETAVGLSAANLERECYGARGLCLIAICPPAAAVASCAAGRAAADGLAERYRRQRPPVAQAAPSRELFIN